ncbi:MAG TPA: MscS mechanosensitive ion channel, partial [Erythrobacter sp.]|nr:MscS mechanosensitive ion channel [Erythrobacter sp.]
VTPSADEPPQAKRAVRDVAASPADEDVRPADEIAAMVEEERNRPGEEQNKDLLDHSRPVE